METDWFKNAIIYHILVDRFSRGIDTDKTASSCGDNPEYCGGNLQGIIDRLDYLEDLGINTIWLSPINSTSAYHGYHVTDYYEVNHHFGTKETLRALIDDAHSRGIKVLMDLVINHMSSQHPYFEEAHKDKNSTYRDWFYFSKNNDYLPFLHFKELAKINLEYQPAREYVINVAKHWLAFGFDGFRIDHVFGPTHTFWKTFRNMIKKDFPETVLIGEAWGFEGIGHAEFVDLKTINIRGKYMKFFQKAGDKAMVEYVGQLDGTLDFKLRRLLIQYIGKDNSRNAKKKLEKMIKKHYANFPPSFYLPSFLDNHDMNRFLFEAGGDKEKLKEAARIQFAQKQPIIIYYGTEAGMNQKRDIRSHTKNGDLEVRQMMPWWNIDEEMHDFYRGLIREKTKI